MIEMMARKRMSRVRSVINYHFTLRPESFSDIDRVFGKVRETPKHSLRADHDIVIDVHDRSMTSIRL